jgi:hypothetical protein
MKNFWFSYQNILKREILKKNFVSFFRKIFGTLYKFLIRCIRHKFSINCINLDQTDKKNFFRLSLDELFIKFNCDKGPYFFSGKEKIYSHNYSIFYKKYFKHLRKKKFTLMELGSHEGKGLVSFFYYFPNSHLIGANINPFQMKFESKRITELFVDVSSKKILKNLSDHIEGDLDIIIDDASHNLRDIIISFSILFKKVKKGGLYVIEDLNQFEVFKELNPYDNKETTPLQLLLKIKNQENFHSSFLNDEEKEYLIKNIESINLEKGSMIINDLNVSDIAFIHKK